MISGCERRTWSILKILRRRSLAALRAQVEPVSTAAYGRFLPAWQQVGSTHNSGVDGLAQVIDQLAGCRYRRRRSSRWCSVSASGTTSPPCSTSCWPPARSPGRVRARSVAGTAGSPFISADSAPLTLAAPAEIEFNDTHRAIMESARTGRGVLLPSARGQPQRRVETGAVGVDLGGLGHRRYLRSGAGLADRHPPRRSGAAAPRLIATGNARHG